MKLRKNSYQDHVKASKEEFDSGNVDMDIWILQLLVGQVKDESKAVVKCALSILEEACTVPVSTNPAFVFFDLGKSCACYFCQL